MLFLVDIGNTNIKIRDDNLNIVENIPENSDVLLCSVNSKKTNEFINSYEKLNIFLPDIAKIPLNIKYSGSPGIDRIVSSLPFIGKKAYIIDAGSMITIDMIKNKNLYLGPIIPGKEIIRNSVFNQIEGIKETSGIDTLKNLEDGICKILTCTVKMSLTESLPIYITGGDSWCLEDIEEAEKRPNLIFEGLLEILKNGWIKNG